MLKLFLLFIKIYFCINKKGFILAKNLKPKKIMRTAFEIKSIFGKVLFRYESENPTFKEAVELACSQGINLEGANMRGANMVDANMRGAIMVGANMRGANMRGANMRGANMRGATLPIICRWSIGVKEDKIIIGCKSKTIEGWDTFFSSSEEYTTRRGTSEFKNIEAAYRAYKAYYLTLNDLI